MRLTEKQIINILDNKFHEYRIATKDEVEKWKKDKEDNFGSKIEIEREVA